MSVSTLSMAMPMSVPSPKGRILCVDDEPNILRALTWLLQKEFEVVTAGGGREALELVHREDFDVVVSDHCMPGMSGIDLLKAVQAVSPRSVRILMTGYAEVHAVLGLASQGDVFRYVTKPWNVAELNSIVAQAAALARSRIAARLHPPAAEPGAGSILALGGNPLVHALVEAGAVGLAPVIHAATVADAVQALREGQVAVIVAGSHLGTAELSRLFSLVRQRHPAVQGIVLAEEEDIELVAPLLCCEQIDRCLPLPVEARDLHRIFATAVGGNGLLPPAAGDGCGPAAASAGEMPAERPDAALPPPTLVGRIVEAMLRRLGRQAGSRA